MIAPKFRVVFLECVLSSHPPLLRFRLLARLDARNRRASNDPDEPCGWLTYLEFVSLPSSNGVPLDSYEFSKRCLTQSKSFPNGFNFST